MTSADGVNLHLLCYLTWYLIIQETLQIRHILMSFPCIPETWIFRAPILSIFKGQNSKTYQRRGPTKRLTWQWKELWTHTHPLRHHALGPSTLSPHPIIKTLLDDGLGGMGQRSTGSRNSLWIQLPKSIPIYRTVQVLSIYVIEKQQSWKKKSYFWQLPTLSICP